VGMTVKCNVRHPFCSSKQRSRLSFHPVFKQEPVYLPAAPSVRLSFFVARAGATRYRASARGSPSELPQEFGPFILLNYWAGVGCSAKPCQTLYC
jgi:hypothetical protein